MTTARLEGGTRTYKTEFPPIVSFSDLGHLSTRSGGEKRTITLDDATQEHLQSG